MAVRVRVQLTNWTDWTQCTQPCNGGIREHVKRVTTKRELCLPTLYRILTLTQSFP